MLRIFAMTTIPEISKPMKFDVKLYRLLLVTACLVVGLDQLTKWLILQYFVLHDTIPVIPGFFQLIRVHNPGGAFGFLADHGPVVRKFVFLVISGIAAGVVLVFYHHAASRDRILAGAFALIFGGAVGNLIDRVRFGYVVDFLDVYVGTMHWPAFNVADSAISVGMVILGFYILTNRMPE